MNAIKTAAKEGISKEGNSKLHQYKTHPVQLYLVFSMIAAMLLPPNYHGFKIFREQ